MQEKKIKDINISIRTYKKKQKTKKEIDEI